MEASSSSFSNSTIAIESLPDYEMVSLNSVSTKLLYKQLIQVTFFAVLLGGGISFLLYKDETNMALIASIVAVCCIGLLMFTVIKKQACYGYALREKDIIYRRGFMVTKTTIVSFNRIQHVSIKRSLLDNRFGIATLQIFTAGGSGSDIQIPGLSPEIATKIKEALAVTIANEDDV